MTRNTRRPSCIARNMTVRQVATAWPACAEVLGRFTDAQLTGRWTLQELFAFARDHALNESEFVQQLADAAGVTVCEPREISEDPSPIGLIFIAIAICLTIGSSWGVSLLLQIAWGGSYSAVTGASIHVHGVAELWGWMALFVFAVASHLLRMNTKRPAPPWLERIAAGLIIAGVVGFFAGLIKTVHVAVPWIDIAGSAALAAAALLFGISVIWSSAGQTPSQRIRGVAFIIAWLWVWAGVDLWLRIHFSNRLMLPDSARQLLIALPVLGFATNTIYGFGIRLIPGFLNIGQLRPRFFTAAFLTHNAGLCLLLLAPPVGRCIGAGMMLCGAALYLSGMNFLRSKPTRPIFGVDLRGHILIRAAFCWLIIGLSMIFIGELIPGLPHPFDGAWRHALTVGFITTMILGVGQRLVPIFIKQPLASAELMLAGAALIIFGCAGRVGLELLTMGGWGWAFGLMGITGILELSALILFAVNLALTVRRRRHVYQPGEPLLPDTRVREAINARPEIQHRLHDAGVTMLDEAPFVAPSMTFGAMALSWGLEPARLLAALEAEREHG